MRSTAVWSSLPKPSQFPHHTCCSRSACAGTGAGASFAESRVAARRAKPPRAHSSPAGHARELEPEPGAGRGDIQVKRIYEPPEPADGYRALIDRLWPRGISRPRAALDNWLIDLAPR